MNNDIPVFAEQRGDRLHSSVPQVVTAAKALAGQTGGKVIGLVVGATAGAADALDKTGVDQIVTVADASLANYNALRYRSALAGAISQLQPRVVLLPATFMGRDLAPRVAARLKLGCATDVIGLGIGGNGGLDVKRPVYNGKAFCHVTFPTGKTAIASVRPNTFPASTGPGGAPRSAIAFTASPGDDRATTREIAKTGGAVKDVTEADIIVSGGRAMKAEENFKIIYELAAELDAAVGASRAACDAGYQPHTRQVGLTGKTVTPKLYVACGVSGAIQHLAGMRGSKVIVAINTDPEAPMVKVADYAIIDDLFKVVPLLTQEVRKLKAH
ncbi:MAG: electron transfer flavoprotein subunit alpha/FixB family protein [Planctomycetes bacterium]|nr:electron transfer flavoprotein subunit alpha/FixB family protein [Planctomycetota bacterium]